MPPSLVTRTTLIDDDGSDTTGTIIDNNEIQKLYDAIDQLASGAGAYTTFEYGGNLKVDGILTANGIAPTSGNANITGNLLVTGRLQVGGSAFGQAGAPSFRAGTVTPQSKQAMEVTSGDNAAWAAVRASAFISTEPGSNLADLTVTGGVNVSGGNVTCAGYMQSTGVMYPGRVDTPAAQASWYLGSHGNYGLYSNTGLFLAGSLWINGIASVPQRFTVRAANAAISAAPGDFILIDSGSFIVYLPAPTQGAIIDIKMYGGGPVTVAAPGGTYLDYPATSYVLLVPNQSVTVVAANGNWWIR